MKPLFKINSNISNKIVGIFKVIGNLELQVERNFKLRKEK